MFYAIPIKLWIEEVKLNDRDYDMGKYELLSAKLNQYSTQR